MPESISFDRAAAFYDATRALPDEIAANITDGLLTAIRETGADRLLELGIGTGRIARPLMAAGIRVTGVDISTQMMAQLIAQVGPEHIPPDLVLGDATRLPFADDTFRAALVVHVFHLVSSPEDAVREIKRVLAPGGVLLQQTDTPDAVSRAAWEAHEEFWDRLARQHGFSRRRAARKDAMDVILQESGAHLHETALLTTEHPNTVEEEVQNLLTRRNSWTWDVPDAVLEPCAAAYEAFLRSPASGRADVFVDRVTYIIQTARWD